MVFTYQLVYFGRKKDSRVCLLCPQLLSFGIVMSKSYLLRNKVSKQTKQRYTVNLHTCLLSLGKVNLFSCLKLFRHHSLHGYTLSHTDRCKFVDLRDVKMTFKASSTESVTPLAHSIAFGATVRDRTLG